VYKRIRWSKSPTVEGELISVRAFDSMGGAQYRAYVNAHYYIVTDATSAQEVAGGEAKSLAHAKKLVKKALETVHVVFSADTRVKAVSSEESQ
jgi:hypothetical protein